jgi:hypothetical protein
MKTNDGGVKIMFRERDGESARKVMRGRITENGEKQN